MIFVTVRESAKAFGDKSTAITDEYSLAKKLALIVASDFACWVSRFANESLCLSICDRNMRFIAFIYEYRLDNEEANSVSLAHNNGSFKISVNNIWLSFIF